MIARKMSFWKIALMSLGLCAHVSSTAQIGAGQDNYDPQALGPGDIISVDIKKVPDLSQNYTIDDNGEVDFPLIGPLQVQGATAADLAKELAISYEKDYLVNPFVTVSIFAKRLPSSRPATPLDVPASLAVNNTSLVFNPETGLSPELSLEPQTDTKVTEAVLGALSVLPEADPQTLPDVVPEIGIDTSPEEVWDVVPDIAVDVTPETYPYRVAEVVPEAVPEIAQDIYPEIVPDIIPEPEIDLAALTAPSPTPQIDSSEPLALALTASHWSIEGSSEDFIHFLGDGDMAGVLGCNSFFARYDAGQSDINISAVTNTNIPCADQSKPQEFIDNLKQTQSYLLSDNNLLLLDDLGELIFALQPK